MLAVIFVGSSVAVLGGLFLVKHPFSAAACLGALGILSCSLVGVWGGSWLACVIFLVIYGGLVVVFGYMVALSPNPTFKVSAWEGAACVSLGGMGSVGLPGVAPEVFGETLLGVFEPEEIVSVGWMGGPLLAVFVIFLFGVMFGVSLCVTQGSGSLRQVS